MGKRSRQQATGLNEEERAVEAQRRKEEEKEQERKKRVLVAKALLEQLAQARLSLLDGKTQ